MYLTREEVMERMRFSLMQYYRLVTHTATGYTNTSDLVSLLNRSRRGIREPLMLLPDDLSTAEEVSKSEIGNLFPDPQKLRAWTKRTRKVPPHFFINKKCVLFSRSLLVAWVSIKNEKNKKGIKYAV